MNGPAHVVNALLKSAALAIALVTLGAVTPAHASEELQRADHVRVERLTFPITTADGQTLHVVGYLYHDGSLRHRPLQVVVHGGTYDHRYWDLPEINGESYSYAQFMVRRHYAVLAIDQLGSGESDKPDGDYLTVDVAGAAVDQVVRAMRSGQNALHVRFEKIALVGHSLGSNVSVYAQGNFHTPVDALVSTGLGHVPHPLPLSNDIVLRAFSNKYWWMTPEERDPAFLYTARMDPDMTAYDNGRFTGLISRGIFMTAMLATFDPDATKVNAVNVPVLAQFGDEDPLFGSAFADGEESFWTSAPSVTVQRLPNIGHCYNSHLSHRESWEGIAAFLRQALHHDEDRD